MADGTKIRSVEELTRAVRGSANWCYWIAGLTCVNAVLMFTGSDSGFLLGMIVPQVVAQIAGTAGPIAKAVAVGFNLCVIGFFVLMGWLARGGRRWPLVLAFLAYGVDSLLLFAAPSVLVIGFHAWVLFALFMGAVTVGALKKARAAEAAGAPISAEQAFAPAGLGTSPENVDRAARDMEEMTRLLYAPKHDRRAVDPRQYRGVDLGFYDRMKRELEGLGFRHLGDYEQADLKGTSQDPGCFLRALTSADGVVTAAVWHYRGASWWLRAIAWVISRGGLKVMEFETEFSDGSFVGTGNCPIAATTKLPPTIDGLQLPHRTRSAELLSRHLERVDARLRARRELTVRMVHTLEECYAAQERQDGIKAAFRQSTGGTTREELMAHANTPAKTQAAELLWTRMQERKRAASMPPPLAAPGAAEPPVVAGGAAPDRRAE